MADRAWNELKSVSYTHLLLSTVLSPISSYAAELPKERKLPLLEEVQSQLDEDEIVLAKDQDVYKRQIPKSAGQQYNKKEQHYVEIPKNMSNHSAYPWCIYDKLWCCLLYTSRCV